MRTIQNKTLKIYGGLHPRVDISRLCASRNIAGRRIRQKEYTILSEQMALQENINNNCLTDPLQNADWQSNTYHVSELDN